MQMHGFILNRGLSPVFILMKQAKKNAFKMPPSIMVTDLLCVCAICRINHVAKTISLLASRMPLRLEVFLQFSFSNIDIIHVVSFVQETLEKRLSSYQYI